jgi:type IV pilus assembly protein PilM
MSKANDSWGIEVGAYAIKAVRLTRKGNEIALADHAILPFSQILTTPDLNVAEAIQVNLDQFLSIHNVARSTVMVSVPGHTAFARFAKLPPVEPKRIPDIVRFEAVQQIPFPIEQVEWDYQTFMRPDSPDVEVGIFAITKARLDEVLTNYNSVGLYVDGMTLSPLAVYNAMAYDMSLDEESPGVIFMDIGTSSTDVIIVEAGNLWMRTLPLGGNHFTEALMRSFKLSFPKAEKLKCEAGTSKYARQIFQAMRPVFADLVQEMQRSLGFYQSLNRDAKLTKLVGVGSTFRLPGMAKFLRQQLQLEVIRPDGFERLRLDNRQATDFAEHAMNMTTAYGLALQGLGLDEVDANILPRDLLKKRVWRAKQPWVGIAAAVMILGAGLAYARLAIAQATYGGQGNQSAISAAEKVVIAATDLKKEYTKVKGSDPRPRIQKFASILQFRDLWIKLLQDVDLAKAALGGQPQLRQDDFNAIRRIDRGRRRQMIIEDMQVSYLYNMQVSIWSRGGGVTIPENTAGATGIGPSAGGAMGGMMAGGPPGAGGFAGGMPGGAMGGMPGGAMGGMPGGIGGGGADGGPSWPTFRITITGTTPLDDGASRMIENGFLKWLLDNAKRENWPYRIVPESVKLLSISAVGGSSSSNSGSRSRGPTAGGMGMSGARGGPPMIGAGGGPGMGAGRANTRNKGAKPAKAKTGNRGTTDLPKPYDVDESRAGDQRFIITWDVRLVIPDQAEPDETKDGKKSGRSSRRAGKSSSTSSKKADK